MKRFFILVICAMVILSLATDLVAGILTCKSEIELVEKEKSAKETDSETDPEKDKIFPHEILPSPALKCFQNKHLHPAEELSSLALEADINPPDLSFV